MILSSKMLWHHCSQLAHLAELNPIFNKFNHLVYSSILDCTWNDLLLTLFVVLVMLCFMFYFFKPWVKFRLKYTFFTYFYSVSQLQLRHCDWFPTVQIYFRSWWKAFFFPATTAAWTIIWPAAISTTIEFTNLIFAPCYAAFSIITFVTTLIAFCKSMLCHLWDHSTEKSWEYRNSWFYLFQLFVQIQVDGINFKSKLKATKILS